MPEVSNAFPMGHNSQPSLLFRLPPKQIAPLPQKGGGDTGKGHSLEQDMHGKKSFFQLMHSAKVCVSCSSSARMKEYKQKTTTTFSRIYSRNPVRKIFPRLPEQVLRPPHTESHSMAGLLLFPPKEQEEAGFHLSGASGSACGIFETEAAAAIHSFAPFKKPHKLFKKTRP